MTLEAGKEMDRRCVMNWLNEVYVTPSKAFDEYTDDELKIFAHDALVLLKEQEPRELTKQEWEDWKKDSKRDPICFMYIGDGTPLWALKPEDINEVLYLTDKIKIYNKKPTEEQRKAVKRDE